MPHGRRRSRSPGRAGREGTVVAAAAPGSHAETECGGGILQGGAFVTTITIDLPDELAEEARSRGLLAAGAVEAMIRETLLRRAARDLLEAANELAAAKFPRMTMAEIQEEVNAVRSARQR